MLDLKKKKKGIALMRMLKEILENQERNRNTYIYSMVAKHIKPYAPYKTMVEMMDESTFCSNNVYGVRIFKIVKNI